jgi:hypothetical protein
MRRSHNMSIAKHVNEVLTDIAKKMGGGKLRVGFLEGATYPDGTPVAAVAAWDEFGHGGNFPSPPRPFFRTMISNESPDWPQKMAYLAKFYGYDGTRVLNAMGEDIAGALRKSIIDTNAPALSQTTLILRKWFGNDHSSIGIHDVLAAQKAAARGEDGASGTQAKPLVWTGHLLASVGYDVRR